MGHTGLLALPKQGSGSQGRGRVRSRHSRSELPCLCGTPLPRTWAVERRWSCRPPRCHTWSPASQKASPLPLPATSTGRDRRGQNTHACARSHQAHPAWWWEPRNAHSAQLGPTSHHLLGRQQSCAPWLCPMAQPHPQVPALRRETLCPWRPWRSPALGQAELSSGGQGLTAGSRRWKWRPRRRVERSAEGWPGWSKNGGTVPSTPGGRGAGQHKGPAPRHCLPTAPG